MKTPPANHEPSRDVKEMGSNLYSTQRKTVTSKQISSGGVTGIVIEWNMESLGVKCG